MLLFCGQLQIHTRCQSHLVEAGTVVTLALIVETGLPVVVRCGSVLLGSHRRTTVRIGSRSTLIGGLIGIVGNTDVFARHEVYVAGQRS